MYEFAIKKDTLYNGDIVLTPVARKKARFIPNKWERITKEYDRYALRDLDWNPVLTYLECQDHIIGYKEELKKKIENTVKSVTYDTLEDHSPGNVIEAA